MEKIDFFAGTHGHFLEIIINLFIHRIEYNNNEIFDKHGACHMPVFESTYIRPIKCAHYSYVNTPFNDDDLVIEIFCEPDDMLPAITNLLLRAGYIKDGHSPFDLDNLEISTIEKLSQIPKADYFLQTLIKEHGFREHYPRSLLRNYFYSKFASPEHGIDVFNQFNHKGLSLRFPMRSFYQLDTFYSELNRCAFFLNQNFYPTLRTANLWSEFMKKNQGYHSQQKCNFALECILSGKSANIESFNIVEEAWILYKISRMFRCYDHPLLSADEFITDTKEISRIIYEWKRGD